MQKVLDKAKAIVAAVGALVTGVSAALADDAVSLDEVHGIVTLALAVATVIGVYAVPNTPPDGSDPFPPGR